MTGEGGIDVYLGLDVGFDVLFAMLRDGTFYEAPTPTAA